MENKKGVISDILEEIERDKFRRNLKNTYFEVKNLKEKLDNHQIRESVFGNSHLIVSKRKYFCTKENKNRIHNIREVEMKDFSFSMNLCMKCNYTNIKIEYPSESNIVNMDYIEQKLSEIIGYRFVIFDFYGFKVKYENKKIILTHSFYSDPNLT